MKPERANGWFHWVLPLMIALGALDVLLSQRNLSLVYAELAGLAEYTRHPAMPWIQRAVSIVLLLICAERLAAHFATRQATPSIPLAWAFLAFWTGTVASPALLGAHREVSHEFLYPLVIGFAALLVTTEYT